MNKPDAITTLSRYQDSTKFYTPPGMAPEDYGDDDFEEDDDGIDPGYDGILGEG